MGKINLNAMKQARKEQEIETHMPTYGAKTKKRCSTSN